MKQKVIATVKQMQMNKLKAKSLFFCDNFKHEEITF